MTVREDQVALDSRRRQGEERVRLLSRMKRPLCCVGLIPRLSPGQASSLRRTSLRGQMSGVGGQALTPNP